MNRSWLRWGPYLAGILAAAPFLIGWHAWRVIEMVQGPPTFAPATLPSVASADKDIGPVAMRALRVAPFRPDGRPSPIAYDPERGAASYVDAPPKPALSLAGVVGGAHPAAMIDGLPGRDAPVLLGLGDTASGIRVRRIRDGEVTLSGMDTTWVLVVRRLE